DDRGHPRGARPPPDTPPPRPPAPARQSASTTERLRSPVAHGPSRTSNPLSTARMMRIVSTTIHPVYAITATVSTIFMPRENLGLFQRYGRPSGPRTKKRRIRTHTGRWYQRTGAGGSAPSTPRILHRRMVVRERRRETRLAAAAGGRPHKRARGGRPPPAP